LLDVGADEGLRTELVTKGGKKQVPFLEDTERGVSMYESSDIVSYLSDYYRTGQDVNNLQ
jgi:glutathione S-transferase